MDYGICSGERVGLLYIIELNESIFCGYDKVSKGRSENVLTGLGGREGNGKGSGSGVGVSQIHPIMTPSARFLSNV